MTRRLTLLCAGRLRTTAICVGAALVALQAHASVSLVAVSDSLDFGELSPAGIAAPLDGLRLLVRSDGPYRLVGTVHTDLEDSTSSMPAEQELQILTTAGTWVPLTRDLPIELSAGTALGPGPATISFPLRANITYDSPAGARHGRLRVTLNEEAEAQIQFKYVVAAVASLREIATERLQQVDPTVRGTYGVERRTFEVTSNTPWAVNAVLSDPLTQRGNSVAIPDARMTVIVAGSDPKSLNLHQPVLAASGPATGSRPRVVRLQFSVTITGDELAGDYKGDVEVTAQPLNLAQK